jgi:hypothetical protein
MLNDIVFAVAVRAGGRLKYAFGERNTVNRFGIGLLYLGMTLAAGSGNVWLIHGAFWFIGRKETVASMTIDTRRCAGVAMFHESTTMHGVFVGFDGSWFRNVGYLIGQLLILVTPDANLYRVCVVGTGVGIGYREDIVTTMASNAGWKTFNISFLPENMGWLAETLRFFLMAFATKDGSVTGVADAAIDGMAIGTSYGPVYGLLQFQLVYRHSLGLGTAGSRCMTRHAGGGCGKADIRRKEQGEHQQQLAYVCQPTTIRMFVQTNWDFGQGGHAHPHLLQQAIFFTNSIKICRLCPLRNGFLEWIVPIQTICRKIG